MRPSRAALTVLIGLLSVACAQGEELGTTVGALPEGGPPGAGGSGSDTGGSGSGAGGAEQGGVANAGGAIGSGGTIGSGGSLPGDGGGSGSAGALGNGGTVGNGGAPGSGGATGAGGVTGNGGASSGGAAGTGGTASGGATGTGGTTSGPVTFAYAPANFDPGVYQSSVASSSTVALACGTSTFDSTALTFGNWCGQFQPAPVVLSQPSGPEIVILAVSSFSVAKGATLELTGSRPVVFVVYGDATVAGIVDASASGTTPGPGGNWSCGASQGGSGSGDSARNDGASGGGGGGFGTAGGSGGKADTDKCCGGAGVTQPGGIGGVARGAAAQAPLLAGCPGGMAGGCATAGGGGGGAVQISAAGTLTVTGTVRANGADGALPCGASDEGGGTGGGSGGGILLEASTLTTTNATLQANGGAGGPDGGYFHCSNGPAGSTRSSNPGGDGQNCIAGSPGGGGGYGRIQTVDH